MLIFDNHKTHKSQELIDMCLAAGVQLAFLPPHSPDLSVRVDMVPEVPQLIQERLVAATDDLRNAVGQEAAKAFLVSLTSVEPVGFEPEAAICDNSWMEFVNEDLMIDASDPSQSPPSSPSGKIEDASLRRTVSQTVADTRNAAPSPHTANPMSPNRSTRSGPCKRGRESEAYQKRERSEYNILEAVVQGLPRSDLLDCLETHWQALTTEGIYVLVFAQFQFRTYLSFHLSWHVSNR